MINSTTGQQIGTLYCIGVIDKNDVDSSFYRVFWKITDSSLTEVNAENSNDDNNSASSESPEYSGYWYNHWGTIILAEPLELPDDGRRYIDEEADWNYSPLDADHTPCKTVQDFQNHYCV